MKLFESLNISGYWLPQVDEHSRVVVEVSMKLSGKKYCVKKNIFVKDKDINRELENKIFRQAVCAMSDLQKKMSNLEY